MIIRTPKLIEGRYFFAVDDGVVYDCDDNWMPMSPNKTRDLIACLNKYLEYGDTEINRARNEALNTDLEPHVPAQVITDHPGFVYLIYANQLYKIGYSKNPKRRISAMQSSHALPITTICVIRTETMRSLESELHKRFAAKRMSGEWFHLAEDDIAYIKELAR